jgi:hypothetical protein
MKETRLHLTYLGPRLKTLMENNQVIGLAVTGSQLSNEVGTRAAINLANQRGRHTKLHCVQVQKAKQCAQDDTEA